VLVLTVFVVLVAGDAVCCPDGCTEQAQSTDSQHSGSSPDAVCLLCLGGADTTPRGIPVAAAVIVDRLPFPSVVLVSDNGIPPPHRPPRA
jgi:hypothetical protein